MGIYVFALDDYIGTDIVDDRIKNKEFRKKLIRDFLLKEDISETEKCIADKSKIVGDEVEKVYRKRLYETGFCYTRDAGLEEYIYYSSSIPYIYHLERLEYINGYIEETILSLLEFIYPAKMPTKDYFPFVEFDIGTKIPLALTKKEKELYKEHEEILSNPNIYEYEVDEFDWCYCIIWLDKHRMFMNLLNEAYYFKQVGKNVHLFKIIIPL